MAKKRFHGGRALLNRPGHQSTGAIVAEVEDTSGWKPGKAGDGNDIDRYNLEPEWIFQVSDCARAVSFDVNFYDKDGRENSLKKVDVMIDCLTKFRDGLAAEQKLYEERMKKVKARKK